MINVPGLNKFAPIENSDLLYKNRNKKFVLENDSQLLLIISGPSGAGKDTIVDKLPEQRFSRIKTCTTRPVRKEEIEVDRYHRLTEKQFQSQVKKGLFIEHATYSGNYYGTRYEDLLKITNQSKIPVLRIDPQGGRSYASGEIKVTGYCPMYFFVTAPSIGDIKKRLLTRHTFSESSDQNSLKNIEERMKLVKRDVKLSSHAHFILINPDGQANKAVEQLIDHVDKLLTHI